MFKDLLVKLEPDETHDCAVDYAISIAEACDAHIAGVAFGGLTVPAFVLPDMPSDALSDILAENERVAQAAITRFEAAAKRSMLSMQSHLVTESEWGPATTFAAMARRFDLSVIHQSNDESIANDPLIEAALFESGRPTIVVPFIQKDGFKLDRVLCCWDGGTASARAVNDALTLLKKAKAVEILIVEEKSKKRQREIPGVEIADHLARHGVKVELETLPAVGIAVADVILSHAADYSADLIVMGGYGHSRMREFVLGGVTRGILDTMTAPVLMSH